MPLHGLCVAAGENEACTHAPGRANGTEDPGRFGALILGGTGPCSASGPPPRELGLLADPGFIRPPDLYGHTGREGALDRVQLGGEAFLKASSAYSFCPL